MFITQVGGQLGPVTFDRQGRRLQPMAIAPWAEEEEARDLPPVLAALRGDFFCLPFGGNATPYHRERHPLHGDTANSPWEWVAIEETERRVALHLALHPRTRRGQVDKYISLVPGQLAVYSRHVVSGMDGPTSLGHHAMLRFPDRPHSGVVSTSPFILGQVPPERVENPEARGYSMLKPGAEFRSLDAVPTITGDLTDLSRYPARRGYEDLAMVISDPDVPFAWTAVTFPRERYAWFALKDPRVLRSTLFWLSNGGRHYPPWNGRHLNVLGLEEVTSYFHYGLAESVQINPLSSLGHATSLLLHPDRPLIVNYIMAVTPVPAGFDRVVSIEVIPDDAEGVRLTCAAGKTVDVPLNLEFLSGK